MLELFCGTAGLTAAFKRLGFSSAVAVDKTNPKFSHASVIVLDLTKSEHQSLVLDWIRHDRTIAVFMAPPCGTCSAARSIPIADDPFAPRPLRSTSMPDGLGDLSKFEMLRVSQANILHNFCQEVFDLCTQLNKPCMVENPLNSLFWLTAPWRELQSSDAVVYQPHQACAYGSKRPKWTLLAANFSEVKSINLVCDNSHPHEPWGQVNSSGRKVFATSLEVHYPTKLCEAIAQCFLIRLQKQFKLLPSTLPKNSDFKAATFVQPKGAKSPALFSPFESKFFVLCDTASNICWPHQPLDLKKAKLLHETLMGGGEHEAEVSKAQHHKNMLDRIHSVAKDAGIDADISSEKLPDNLHSIKTYGVLLTPEAFVKKAMAVEHPMSVESCLPDVLHQTVSFLAKSSDFEVVSVRTDFVKRWLTRAQELSVLEKDFRAKMDPSISKVTAKKRILLFKEILEQLKYPDLQVVEELSLGVDLRGEVPVTDMLPQKRTPQLLTDDALKSRSRLVRKTVRSSVGPSGDSEMDSSIWGWLRGPLEDSSVPLDAPISRRFGVRQKSKIRPVDDFSASGVNNAAGVSEAPALHTIDVIASMLVDWLRCNKTNGRSTDTFLRTFDLKSAYRQIGLSQAGRDRS